MRRGMSDNRRPSADNRCTPGDPLGTARWVAERNQNTQGTRKAPSAQPTEPGRAAVETSAAAAEISSQVPNLMSTGPREPKGPKHPPKGQARGWLSACRFFRPPRPKEVDSFRRHQATKLKTVRDDLSRTRFDPSQN